MTPLRARLRTATLLSVFVVSASVAAAPAQAGDATTWYVSPSVTSAGIGSCGSPDFTSIQTAVDASGPNDTILVCPGFYDERVAIVGSGHDGLTIRSTQPWKATIRVAPDHPDGEELLGISGSRRVTIQHLRFLAVGNQVCELAVGPMIRVSEAVNVNIRANRMRSLGNNTLDFDCGYQEGIRLVDSTGRVQLNLIKDFLSEGIVSTEGPDAGTLRVLRNSIRYHHAAADDIITNGNGINLEFGGGMRSIVKGNRVVGLSTVGQGSEDTPQLRLGIYVDSPVARVRDNIVRRADYGLFVSSRTSAVVDGNASLGNKTYDCFGSNGAEADWTNNIGDSASPTGICVAP